MLEERRVPTTYFVTNPGDDVSGATPHQLRWAIDQVNAGSGGDAIAFDIGTVGTTQTITVNAPLPAISQAAGIWGWSQGPGYGVWIEINGAGLSADGLTLDAGGCTVGGLAVANFGGNGIVINNPAGAGDTIQQCNVGTDTTGTAAGLGNGGNGILITGAGNVIGPNNVVAGNAANGIDIRGSQGNLVTGDNIGVNVTGTAALPNGRAGVLLEAGATNNTIGSGLGNGWGVASGSGSGSGTGSGYGAGSGSGSGSGSGYGSGSSSQGSPANNSIGGIGSGPPGSEPGNIISANATEGIYVTGSSANVIGVNAIGLAADGSTPLGNGAGGILLDNGSSGNRIGLPFASNVISGNGGPGISLNGAGGNTILANLIGTDGGGSTEVPNQGDGITITSGSSNTIGGTGTEAGNVISGNAGNGITITGESATGNLVSVNLIGTDKTGTAAVGNGNDGIYISSSHNMVGAWDGTSSGDGTPTILSGDANAEIDLAGDDNDVVNCYIGADITGMVGIGNGLDGIDVEGDGNTIGVFAAPPLPGAKPPPTLIINRGGDGIYKKGQSKLTISNCYVGVDANGITAKPNHDAGIKIEGGGNNTVSDNVISGNGGSGIWIESSNKNVVQDNFIGTDARGSLDVPNGDGVSVVNSNNNTIGGSGLAGQGNVISGNRGNGISISASDGTVVQGNYIGTDSDGGEPLPNTDDGIKVGGSNKVIIGGSWFLGLGNVISSNKRFGIFFFASSGSIVQGNYIGTDSTGTFRMGNGSDGIRLSYPTDRTLATKNTIGGTVGLGLGNLISANTGAGVRVFGNNNTVQGNLIGTDISGRMDFMGNTGDGVDVAGTGNTIGGSWSTTGNLISGNVDFGVYITGSYNSVQGNYIGTDISGTSRLGNASNGVELSGLNNTIGGAGDAGNLISANRNDGIRITFGMIGNIVQGNWIGADASGSAQLGNRNNGITVDSADNTVGGDTQGQGNVISGNAGDGIFLDLNAAANLIEQNYIGTDVKGGAKLGNAVGIWVYSGGNTIGGPLTGDPAQGGSIAQGNIVSGNTADGIHIDGGNGCNNAVLGNYIGLGADGATLLGNGASGVCLINGASFNTIGGANASEGNIISANGTLDAAVYKNGVTIAVSSIGNMLYNNFIGTDVTGKKAVGNQGDGVYIDPTAYASYDSNDPNWPPGGTYWNAIGGANGDGNVISANKGYGINLPDATDTIPDGTIEDWNTIGFDTTAPPVGPLALNNTKGGRRAGKYGANDKGQ